MIKLSQKQKRIAKAKVRGLSNKQIGEAEYPNANPDSQGVIISRELAKPQVAEYIEGGKQKAIEQLGITWVEILKPRLDALQAVKWNEFTGEIVTDHLTRLKASESLEKIIQDKKVVVTTPILERALEEGIDEIQLVRLLKKND